jgi:Mg/Co/Ni transporter MgtE
METRDMLIQKIENSRTIIALEQLSIDSATERLKEIDNAVEHEFMRKNREILINDSKK